MLALVLLAAVQQHSAPVLVRVRVAQTCTLSLSGARCRGARDRPPVMTREGDHVVYRF